MSPRNTSTGGVLEALIIPALKRDTIARLGSDEILISLKWQQTSGTAEQKVPFEVMCLADAIRANKATHAYLVYAGLVKVLTLEAFIRLANNGQL